MLFRSSVLLADLVSLKAANLKFARGVTLQRLVKLGLNGQSVIDILKLSQILPPVADLILFAIRGVFDLEESETFKEFEGLPPELVDKFRARFPQTGTGLEGSVTHFVREAKTLR